MYVYIHGKYTKIIFFTSFICLSDCQSVFLFVPTDVGNGWTDIIGTFTDR